MPEKVRNDLQRCWWARNPLSIIYHDEQWGVPVHADVTLFEMIILEGAQAGLSWHTILRKRDNYRRAFDGFDPAKVARYDGHKVTKLLSDEGIVRNRLKIEAAVANARTVLQVQKEFGSLDSFIWQFAPVPRKRPLRSASELPSRSAESDEMSKELRKLGFRFVGSTICYAFMQAVGMVNDHLEGCFRYSEISGAERSARG
jgi:DNA-3-methyladenine glycosylase I